MSRAEFVRLATKAFPNARVSPGLAGKVTVEWHDSVHYAHAAVHLNYNPVMVEWEYRSFREVSDTPGILDTLRAVNAQHVQQKVSTIP